MGLSGMSMCLVQKRRGRQGVFISVALRGGRDFGLRLLRAFVWGSSSDTTTSATSRRRLSGNVVWRHVLAGAVILGYDAENIYPEFMFIRHFA